MGHFYYCPFSNETDGNHSWAQTQFKQKYGPNTVLGKSKKSKPLSVVKPDDLLIIQAHSNKGLNDCGGHHEQSGHQYWETMTASQLASRLNKKGLSEHHKVIRLYMCWAGGSVQGDPPILFARELAKEMTGVGFKNIIVGGYPGTVSGDFVTPTTMDEGNGHIRCTGRGRYFDGRGYEVPNPRNADKARQWLQSASPASYGHRE